MASHGSEKTIPLPSGWTKRIKSALIQSVSLAATALTLAHGRAPSNRSPRKRMAAELDRANTEIALLKEELDIKDARWSRLPSRRRPYTRPSSACGSSSSRPLAAGRASKLRERS